MRHLFHFLALVPLFVNFACSSSPPERASGSPTHDQEAALNTDSCLDNPDLSRLWGDCNVKHTLYEEAQSLSACRKLAPKAQKGLLNFELQVRSDGSVKYARARPNSKYPKLEGCIVRVLKRLRFAEPPKGKEPKIVVPYQLEP